MRHGVVAWARNHGESRNQFFLPSGVEPAPITGNVSSNFLNASGRTVPRDNAVGRSVGRSKYDIRDTSYGLHQQRQPPPRYKNSQDSWPRSLARSAAGAGSMYQRKSLTYGCARESYLFS